MDEKDFRTQISREQFEKMNEDLFDRVQGPVLRALEAAGITMDIVDQVRCSSVLLSKPLKMMSVSLNKF